MENADTTLPKVSVILTTFNREYFFTEAIESILEQDYPIIEIIISDDGSSDNTFAFACEYAKDSPLYQGCSKHTFQRLSRKSQ